MQNTSGNFCRIFYGFNFGKKSMFSCAHLLQAALQKNEGRAATVFIIIRI